MGNIQSSPGLGLVALSRELPLSKNQLSSLMRECVFLNSSAKCVLTIDRDTFHGAMVSCLFHRSVIEVFDHLFTLWDSKGYDFVEFRIFLVGISPLACGPRDSLSSALFFSMELMDPVGTGCINPSNLSKILIAINSTASFLGDPVLANREIQEIVRHVFLSYSYTRTNADLVPRLVRHPKVAKIINGKGTERYQIACKKKRKKGTARERNRMIEQVVNFVNGRGTERHQSADKSKRIRGTARERKRMIEQRVRNGGCMGCLYEV
mmetsp:Transcript_13468/g.14953  ORF Transcript_13468/g.14953 Transcript_13468/m.14953 type:complete len:265 (+) Transcript_13468:132-926(+)